MGRSLFERLEGAGHEVVMLTVQYRMHPGEMVETDRQTHINTYRQTDRQTDTDTHTHTHTDTYRHTEKQTRR